ncbi:MAG: CBS domain-containing protein, partial [Desulfobacteraceae bacterium]
MKHRTIKELMVPISEYATVSDDATLFEAIEALKAAQKAYDGSKYLHRAILVLNKNKQVVGKISQLDALRALEPLYANFQLTDSPTAFRHFTRSFLKSMLEQYRLFDKPLDDICRKAAEQRVTQFMYKPVEGEYVDENATLDEAIHLLIMGHHQSMLVTDKGKIVGVLRLTDI